MFNKTFLKFFGGGLVIILLGLAIIYGLDYYHYRRSPEYQAQKYFEELRRQYEEDTYGGTTPEETLALFIDALKRGDIDLASKYFVVDEQEVNKKELAAFSEIQVQNLINDILVARKDKNQDKDKAIFEYTKKVQSGYTEVSGKKINIPPGNYLQTIVLVKNINNQWKILEL